MKPIVKIYVEGGGDYSRLKTLCRKGFRTFFERANFQGHMPQVIACGSRREAFDDFCTALNAGVGKLEECHPEMQTKATYSKGAHSFQILAVVDPRKIELSCPYAKRLLGTLRSLLGAP